MGTFQYLCAQRKERRRERETKRDTETERQPPDRVPSDRDKKRTVSERELEQKRYLHAAIAFVLIISYHTDGDHRVSPATPAHAVAISV
eukprot:COSAG03_NODE_4242_length_1626_cov_37.825574_2_plen_89_part_00